MYQGNFTKNEEFAETFWSVINTYVNLKHARKLSKEEINSGPYGRTWYCLHHHVFNPNMPRKCRVVFDVSAKSKGLCLNDILLKCPNLLTNLIGILLRFRQHAVPIVADVKKMFHQVRVRSSDGPAFRFKWRDPGDTKPPDIYQMKVHLIAFFFSFFCWSNLNCPIRENVCLTQSAVLCNHDLQHKVFFSSELVRYRDKKKLKYHGMAEPGVKWNIVFSATA
jgi:hypothetical protein